MPSVNPKSLREEFNHLKDESTRLASAGKLSQEAQTLINAMMVLFELLIAVFLEKTAKKNSKNSSLPSSQTDKDETTPETGAKGKGKKQKDIPCDNTRTVETVEVVAVTDCIHCGADLKDTPVIGYERRTRIDIVFEKTVEHFEAEIKDCPHCQIQNKGPFPKDMSGPQQYGAGIKAYVINMLIAQMLSLKRVQQSIQTLIGQILSEATLLKYVMQLHHALEAWERSAIEKLLQAPSLHVDETSMRVNRKNHWVHVYAAGDITLKFLHPKRGLEAIEAIGIIPRYGGVIIHDCWKSYLSYVHCGHALCGSHLLRELVFIIETNGYAWAINMKRALQEACAAVARSETKTLTDQEYKNLQKRFRNILTRGEKELPPIPPKPSGKRGRVAKSDAHNLLERLREHEKAVLLFAKNPDVPFTNNRGERDLRMNKVKQKISGCFRTQKYAEAYCRISSYLKTMAYRGYNPLVAIQMALSGKIYEEG
jgi:transposase